MPAPTAAGGWTRSCRSPTASLASSFTMRCVSYKRPLEPSGDALHRPARRGAVALSRRPTSDASHGARGARVPGRHDRPVQRPCPRRRASAASRSSGSSSSPPRARFRRLLVRSAQLRGNRTGSTPDRYQPTSAGFANEPVLLIDDTWTTGANAQSAAAALKRAGAGPVAAVVIGRHLNRDGASNDSQLNGLPKPFDWDHCARCQQPDVRRARNQPVRRTDRRLCVIYWRATGRTCRQRPARGR